MKKLNLFLIIISVSIFAAFSLCFAEGVWVNDGENKKYQENDEFVKNSWKFIKIDDTTYNNYYFDENGNMVTGIYKIGDQFYSFNSDGSSNTNGKIIIYGDEYSTKNKGLIEGLDPNFDIEAWKNSVEVEKKQAEQNAQFMDELKNSLELQKQQMEAQEKEAQKNAELKKIEEDRLKNEERAKFDSVRVTTNRNHIDTMMVRPSKGVVITIKYSYPVLEGYKADEINAIMKQKLYDLLLPRFSSAYSDTDYKMTIRLENTLLEQNFENNFIVITVGLNTSDESKIKVDLNTLEFTDISDLK